MQGGPRDPKDAVRMFGDPLHRCLLSRQSDGRASPAALDRKLHSGSLRRFWLGRFRPV